jgi:surface antigen
MFNAKVSAAKNWMVVGKLLILAAISPAMANDISNPRFFEYRTGSFINEVAQISFGWFKTFDDDQKDSYTQALYHAVMFAENGQAVEWYKRDASGVAVPVMTWPTGSGYCRRMHVQAIAYGVQKTLSSTACFSNASSNWRWIRE